MNKPLTLLLTILPLALAACQPGAVPTATVSPTATVPPAPTVEPTQESAGTILLVFGNRFIHEIYVVERPAFEAAGYKVIVASRALQPLHAKESDLIVTPDILLKDVRVVDYDAIIFNCDNDITMGSAKPETNRIAQEAVQQHKVVGAICSGPAVLGYADVIRGIKVTGPTAGGPAECQRLATEYGAICTGALVERDGLIITGKDRWAAKSFTQTILDALQEQ
ncbi:MAG: DJ-1/PfpI family protein [Chloroflexi bacterium]|nr:DJ-1/PfpI family protein [Chloroflexota bacterium]MBU1749476.1 DJ-1/PfpI family protein [Chloroflexota bacterium]